MTVKPSHYKPKRTGLASELLRFYTDNPDEELSLHDIASKFNCGESNVSVAVHRLIQAGVLEITPKLVRKRKS